MKFDLTPGWDVPDVRRHDAPTLSKTALVFTLLMSTLLAACSMGAAEAPAARSAILARGALQASISASGNIQAEDEAKLAFQATGTVAQINVKIGDTVQKGAVLARLDTTDAEWELRKAQTSLQDADAALIIAQSSYSRTVARAQPAEIAAAQSSVKAANDNYKKVLAGPTEAEYQSAKAQLANAEAELRQAQSAYDNAFREDPAGIGAHPAALALEKATNNYNAAKADFDKAVQPANDAQTSTALQQIADARAQLEKVRLPAPVYDIVRVNAEVEQARIKIAQAGLEIEQAQRKLDRSQIVATLDGVVAAVDVKAGETARTDPVITLVDVSRLRIDINVDEIDVSQVQVGQAVNVQLDSLPGLNLQGKVSRISPISKMVNGVVSYVVTVGLPQAEAKLKPGMTANTRIVLQTRENVVLVPNWAIRKDKQTGKTFVTVPASAPADGAPANGGTAQPNQTQEAEVVLGLKDDTHTEVISGVSDGQTVFQPAAITNPLAQ